VDSILRAAAEVLDQHGQRGLSLRRVAARAAISLGTVQYYFATKDALIEAILDEPFEQIFALGPEATALLGESNVLDVIEQTIRRAYRFARKFRSSVRLNMWLVLDRGAFDQRRKHGEEALMEAWVALLSGGFEISRMEARMLAKSIIASAARFVSVTDDELRRIVGSDASTDIESVHRKVEDHLVELARRFLAPARRA
jgi:AcrR family transcriptional regulator